MRRPVSCMPPVSGPVIGALHCAAADSCAALAAAVVGSLRQPTKLRGDVVSCAAHALPNNGKVIDNRRRSE
ncbi:hypothetical protein [Accumulibacter sp.]|uniref:hypothetical protein n=1 Tax=Accumulibacter sp. TaxID=2053492 RepID=UPI0025BC8BCA|nr:hypothetical protein [Accumulibacter sp.]